MAPSFKFAAIALQLTAIPVINGRGGGGGGGGGGGYRNTGTETWQSMGKGLCTNAQGQEYDIKAYEKSVTIVTMGGCPLFHGMSYATACENWCQTTYADSNRNLVGFEVHDMDCNWSCNCLLDPDGSLGPITSVNSETGHTYRDHYYDSLHFSPAAAGIRDHYHQYTSCYKYNPCIAIGERCGRISNPSEIPCCDEIVAWWKSPLQSTCGGGQGGGGGKGGGRYCQVPHSKQESLDQESVDIHRESGEEAEPKVWKAERNFLRAAASE